MYNNLVDLLIERGAEPKNLKIIISNTGEKDVRYKKDFYPDIEIIKINTKEPIICVIEFRNSMAIAFKIIDDYHYTHYMIPIYTNVLKTIIDKGSSNLIRDALYFLTEKWTFRHTPQQYNPIDIIKLKILNHKITKLIYKE